VELKPLNDNYEIYDSSNGGRLYPPIQINHIQNGKK